MFEVHVFKYFTSYHDVNCLVVDFAGLSFIYFVLSNLLLIILSSVRCCLTILSMFYFLAFLSQCFTVSTLL